MLTLEVLQLWDFLAAASKVECNMTMMTESSAIEWLRWIYGWQAQETVPNIVFALQLFLMLTVSVATAERSFSKLKLIKSYLRSTLLQDRLPNLTLISIEHKTVPKIEFDLVISNFASAKSQNVKI